MPPDAESPLTAQGPTLRTLAPGVHLLGGQGHSLAVETSAGVVLVDTGSSRRMAESLHERLRTVTEAPVRWIVYSHGHLGYNYGVPAWLAAAEGRGEPRPTVVAHRNVAARYRRYHETTGLQNTLNRLQFRGTLRTPDRLPLTFPDQEYEGSLTLHAEGGRTVRLLSAPSETDDVTAVWLPEERLLYGSAAVIHSVPNVGTPLRTQRDPVRWADTLDRLADLRPAVLVPEFGRVLEDPGEIRRMLTGSAAALRWLRRETVARMNRGMTAAEIVNDLDYPAELFGTWWMKPVYGHPEFIVRDIYRSENGWWEDRNPTSLHPAAPAVAATAVASAITDKAGVLARVRELRDAGRLQEALHAVDLLALAPAGDGEDGGGEGDGSGSGGSSSGGSGGSGSGGGGKSELAAARRLKAELCALLAERASSYISRSVYLAAREER
ncbi:alkyl sulfatase dimerization domain-containing protein [Phaeacidiphilus oryzae]|uniref:alkyl sulfatase dimerization domain-containing protein n=1 Tax=Phaeacidiphilus oryzae TaxID=348818 RepID=UPI00055A1555|nr:alkyl sulfatase dimerization domain-containing protein [Phaeacidiphilus oryzae]